MGNGLGCRSTVQFSLRRASLVTGGGEDWRASKEIFEGGVKRFFRNLVGSSREIGEIISIDVWVGLGSCGGVIVVCAKFEEFVWK